MTIHSNVEFIGKNFLHFDSENNDIYYLIKIISRKKDVINKKDTFHCIFGSHNERLITSFCVTNQEEFEKYSEISKYLVESLPYTRAYFNVNPKSKKKTLLNLNNSVNNLVANYVNQSNVDIAKQIHRLSNSILSLDESNSHRSLNYVLFDIDILDKEYENIKILNFFIEYLRGYNIEYKEYNTLNGKHLILAHKDYGKLINPKEELHNVYKEFINHDFVEVKTNPALLLVYKMN